MSFEQAPVTKGLMVGLGALSLCAGVFDVKHYLHLQLVPHISRHHQYWRLFVHHLAYSDSSDLFVAELVLFNLGIQVERQFGSIKFSSFAVVTLLVATIFEFLALLLLHRVGLNVISSGPTTLVFSILYQYSRLVPSSYDLRVFGVPLNNKSFIYAPALQLALGHYPASVIVAMIGILTGQLYRSDLANLKSYRLPPSIVRFSQRFLYPLVGSLRAPYRTYQALPEVPVRPAAEPALADTSSAENTEVITTARAQPQVESAGAVGAADGTPASANSTSVVREWVDELTGRAQNAAAGLRVVSETEVAQVMSVFPDVQRSVIVTALQRSPNAESVVETLLSAQR